MDKLVIRKYDHKVTVDLDDDAMNKLKSLLNATGRSVPYIIAECVKFAIPRIEIKS